MKWGLRAKVLLPVGLILLIVQGTSTFVHIQNLKRNYLEAIEWRAKGLAHSILKVFTDERKTGLTLQQMSGLLSLRSADIFTFYNQEYVTHVAVIDEAGMIVAHNNKDFLDVTIESPILREHLSYRELTTIRDGSVYHTLIPIVDANAVYVGTIDMGFPGSVVDEKVRDILSRSVGLFVLFVVLAFIAISVLVHVVMTKPLGCLVMIGKQIAQGELRERTVIGSQNPYSSDEIGVLSGVFHDMGGYLNTIALIATRIATGDLSQKVSPKSEHDVLGQAFQQMSMYLNEMASAAESIASGDLRQNIQPRTEHDVLGNAFQQMKSLQHSMSEIMSGAGKLREASEGLNQISAQMASAANQTAQQTHIVSSNSQQISENVNAIAVSTEEFSANIRELSKNTTDVAQVAGSAVEMATSANTIIAELETRSEEIGAIIKIITAITQQTNLLALNATIEAARAGEAGKGFAVVAHEIKELSREIAISAEDIIHKLETIQTGSKGAREAIDKVSTTIMQISDLSESIASGIEEQRVTTDEIVRRITETAGGSQEITKVIIEVSAMAQNTSEGATNVQVAASELDMLADQLQQLLGGFRI